MPGIQSIEALQQRISHLEAEQIQLIQKLRDGDFGNGVRSMARNCLPAIALLRKGTWTFDNAEKWLNAVIANDPEYLKEIALEIALKTTDQGVTGSGSAS